MSPHPQRGQVYRCDLGYGLKPWLVVSNNARNRLLADIVAIRLTTTARDLPTWVKLSAADFVRISDRRADAFCRQGFGALLAGLAAGIPVQLSTPATSIDIGRGAEVQDRKSVV